MDSKQKALLRNELIRDEGLRMEAYQDSVGLWTIGVGHLLGMEKRMLRLTPEEVDVLLNLDIDIAYDRLRQLLPEIDFWVWQRDLNGPKILSRERALVNMAFNLGNKLGDFRKFIAAVKVLDWQTAAVEMMNSKWAKQVGKRAERLRDMILTED